MELAIGGFVLVERRGFADAGFALDLIKSRFVYS
jgi:hypothetical protein